MLDAEKGKKWIKENVIELHCVCRAEKEKGDLMIVCEACRKFFHPECVEEEDEDWVDSKGNPKKGYVCPECVLQYNIPNA